MGYIIVLLHYAALAAAAGLQKVRRICGEVLLGAGRIRGFTIWDTIYYHDGHTWALQEAGGKVRVGLDDFAVNLLGNIDSVTLPGVGGELREGEESVRFTCGKNSAWAVSPVNGTVTSVNSKAGRDPSVISRDPYGKGWMFTLKPANGGIKRLLKGEEARNWFLNETEKLHQILTSELGMTMADGGSMARNIGRKLENAQWHEIVRTFLKAGKQ